MSGLIFDGAAPGRRGRVLVIDDEESVRRPIRLILTRAGYEVVECVDADEGIRTINEGDNPLVVDAIVCDIRMPRKDGTEAIAYFRAQYPSVPVLVLTGYPDVELATALMKQGVKDYLVKPVTREDLLATIEKAVGAHVILNNQFVV